MTTIFFDTLRQGVVLTLFVFALAPPDAPARYGVPLLLFADPKGLALLVVAQESAHAPGYLRSPEVFVRVCAFSVALLRASSLVVAAEEVVRV
jgi:hypothetical protein